MKTKLDQKAARADVADISAYRAQKLTATESGTLDCDGRYQRIEDARSSAIAQFDALRSPAIAYAAILLSEDGSITLSANGIEPEFAPAISSALASLRDRITSYATHSPSRPRSYSGFARLAPLISMAFMAATYINQVAWIDAALSIASQFAVSYVLSRTRQRQ